MIWRRITRVRTVLAVLGVTLSFSAVATAFSDPTSAPPSPGIKFSADPTESELRAVRLFSEPLVPVGRQPSSLENHKLASALSEHEKRAVPDDFSALEQFLSANPDSAWVPALQFDLAVDYYNTGWYSKALDAWRKAWLGLKNETDPAAKALADRTAGELAYMLSRLGRMEELATLLDEVKGRVFVGSATEKIAGAQDGLWHMRNRPETSFKCGPYALDSILASHDRTKAGGVFVREAASTTNGCSLSQVASLSQKMGMNYQMAYRSNNAAFVLPAVVNWKAGHYAALVRQEGGLYLLQDPTFGNSTWVSARALDREASGYFLVPDGKLPSGWRTVTEAEGATIFGKGVTSDKDNTATTPADQCNCQNGSGAGSSYWSLRGFFSWTGGLLGKNDPADHSNDPQAYPYAGIRGMAVSAVQLSVVGLNLRDNPLGYAPPVGPEVRLILTYNQRDAGQPANFSFSNLGPKWTFNWLAYIADNPSAPSADVNFYTDGGGDLPFTGFNTNSQAYVPQIKTQALLTRTSTNSYLLLQPDGSKIIFALPDSVGGTSRHVFMTQMIDPAGNSIQIGYDGTFRITTVTDAIGQVTTLSYTNALDTRKITKVTDPFGRLALFGYDSNNRLASITDTMGMMSQFTYNSGDFIQAFTTPYGTTSFQSGGTEPQRWLVTTYPDGEQDRVEFLESTVDGISMTEPANTVPAGMSLTDTYLIYRNTFYWDRNAYSQAPTDYTKAHLFHWLHLTDGISSSILESERVPLENRVWYTYDGQPSSIFIGTTASPNRIGRVLDDGTTQIRSFHYNSMGRLTNSVDPAGRSMTAIYSTNLVDLLEVHQTTGTNNDLLARFLYNNQHLPAASWDAAGQMTTNTYNARGQLLTVTDAKNQTSTFNYDPNGYLLSIHGPLAGPNDVVSYTYDSAGRVKTYTDMDGYIITYGYDNLDRLTNMAYPDGTSTVYTFDKLDRVKVQDRLGRTTQYTYDTLRRITSIQDPLGRATTLQYCGCGGLSAVIDPLGRPTRWVYDIQGRATSKQFPDGSSVVYNYENTSSRLQSIQNEKGEIKTFTYGIDDHLLSIAYLKSQVATPSVGFTYDANYDRMTAMQDGIGTTTYSYTSAGSLGALQPATITGPWANETVTYQYDELGRMTNRAINGVPESFVYDVLSRTTNMINALGSFNYDYDGATRRLLDAFYPNGQATHYTYFDNPGDHRLQVINHVAPNSSIISRLTYAYNSASQITNWVQELGVTTNTWAPAYDLAEQLLGAQITSGTATTNYTYNYDPAGNRLLETFSVTNRNQFNLLNQLVGSSDSALINVTYEWDGEARLTAINSGTARSEFSYDGLGRRSRIVEKTNGVVQSEKRYAWCGTALCEERDATDTVIRRFFGEGFTVGATNYFYTRDHLGSVREVIDSSGQVQSRYTYDPYGRRTTVLENQPAPFAFAGNFLHPLSGLCLSPTRCYSPELGRWLSRDPLGESQGANLYAYVGNNPLNLTDPLGLCWAETWNQIKQLANDEYTKAHSWYLLNVDDPWIIFWAQYGFYGGTGLTDERKTEIAQQASEWAERASQFISGEASTSPLVPLTGVISKDPAALAAGITQAVTYGAQIQESINLVNSGGTTPTPIIQGAQKVSGAVAH